MVAPKGESINLNRILEGRYKAIPILKQKDHWIFYRGMGLKAQEHEKVRNVLSTYRRTYLS